MSLTHYQLVGEFHEIFNYPCETELQINILKENPKLINQRLVFIEEERDEFDVALKNNDLVEMADALLDMNYFIFGTAQCMGYCMDYMQSFIFNKSKENNNYKVNFDFETNNLNAIIDEYLVIIDDLILVLHDSKTNDIELFCDTLSKLIEASYSLGYKLNFDMDSMFRNVHESNMSKICLLEEDAIKTVDLYKESKTYEDPAYKVVKHNEKTYYVVYDKKLNKILKFYNWHQPNLKQFMI